MKSKFGILLMFLCTLLCSLSAFANGRAKWLVDSSKKAETPQGFVIKEVKTPPLVSGRLLDFDNQCEIPRCNFGKSLSPAFFQQNDLSIGEGLLKMKLPSGFLNIYSFQFIRLLLFPHHAFD